MIDGGVGAWGRGQLGRSPGVGSWELRRVPLPQIPARQRRGSRAAPWPTRKTGRRRAPNQVPGICLRRAPVGHLSAGRRRAAGSARGSSRGPVRWPPFVATPWMCVGKAREGSACPLRPRTPPRWPCPVPGGERGACWTARRRRRWAASASPRTRPHAWHLKTAAPPRVGLAVATRGGSSMMEAGSGRVGLRTSSGHADSSPFLSSRHAAALCVRPGRSRP